MTRPPHGTPSVRRGRYAEDVAALPPTLGPTPKPPRVSLPTTTGVARLDAEGVPTPFYRCPEGHGKHAAGAVRTGTVQNGRGGCWAWVEQVEDQR